MEEAALTNAILKVTRNTKKVVYFVTGHGEPVLTDSDRTGYSVAKQALEEQNYTVQELVLARQLQVPDDAAVVIVAGPRRDFLESGDGGAQCLSGAWRAPLYDARCGPQKPDVQV